VIESSADDRGVTGWDDRFGFGRVNAYSALLAAEQALWIMSSNPPSGAIDARQPHDLDGTNPTGWDRLDITFTNQASEVFVPDFAVSVENGTATDPYVIDVVWGQGPFETVTVILNRPIDVGAWTTITHVPSGTSVRLGYLPGDVDNDGTSGPADILTAIDGLNGIRTLAEWQLDVDRDGVAASADVLRVVDLLNGAAEYPEFRDQSLP